jgi:hypothetical protein
VKIKATPYRVLCKLLFVGAAYTAVAWENDAETEFPLKGSSNVYQVSINLNGWRIFRIFLGNNFTSNGN